MPISDIRSTSEGSFAAAIALAVLLLLAGFALATSGFGHALSDVVAMALAWAATLALAPFGFDLIRDGVELRSALAGWAIRVSEVCDGIGLFVALTALILLRHRAAGSLTWRAVLGDIGLGFLAIQLFNLARVVVLAVVLGTAPEWFDSTHAGLFPFLTFLLVTWLCLPRQTLPLLWGLAAALSLIWPFVAGPIGALLVAPANLLLGLIAPLGIGTITPGASGNFVVDTTFVASLDPVQLFVAPIRPADFLLAVPVLAVAALLSRRIWPLALALVAMALALVCGALTASWALAEAQAPLQVLRPDGAGAYIATDYTVPALAQSLISVLQSSLVHLNYLVLPVLMLAAPSRRTKSHPDG